MSDPRPDDDPELIVSLPEGSLDDLFAGLEASLQANAVLQTPEPRGTEPATAPPEPPKQRHRPQLPDASSGEEPCERSRTSSSPSCGWPSRDFRCAW